MTSAVRSESLRRLVARRLPGAQARHFLKSCSRRCFRSDLLDSAFVNRSSRCFEAINRELSSGSSNTGTESSNPLRSTPQSLRFWTDRRIARKARVCARFASTCGPGERRLRRELAKRADFSPRPNCLGPSGWRLIVSV